MNAEYPLNRWYGDAIESRYPCDPQTQELITSTDILNTYKSAILRSSVRAG